MEGNLKIQMSCKIHREKLEITNFEFFVNPIQSCSAWIPILHHPKKKLTCNNNLLYNNTMISETNVLVTSRR